MITTRGFTGRGRAKADEKRVPPGQYVTEDFPVLSAGPATSRVNTRSIWPGREDGRHPIVT